MQRVLILISFVIGFINNSNSQNEPTSAPKVEVFSLDKGMLQGLSNSINFYTGKLNIPLGLASLPSKNGLAIEVDLFYNSSVQNVVDTWNVESPTSIVGLGWDLPQSKIIVDNKETGTMYDDEFFLIENGKSSKLICVSNDFSYNEYRTKNFQNWIIRYYPTSEKWEITRDDGSVYTYGDRYSGRNTVEWVIKWGNWIGSSSITSGQQRQGLVWNISEVRTLWGDNIRYTYSTIERTLGTGGLTHTEASYLEYIEDSWGNAVDFVYANKEAVEYADPHLESDEPDGHQDRYESKYLDKLFILSEGIVYTEIDLSYGFINSGNVRKRLLTSVSKINEIGESLSVMSFQYWTSGLVKGALRKVITPFKGEVEFIYNTSGVSIPLSFRDMDITAPPGYAEPDIHFGEDYIIVTWRLLGSGGSHAVGSSAMNVKVNVYTWDGRWIPKTDFAQDVANVRMNSSFERQYQVATGRDFFAILNPNYSGNIYTIYLYHKDEKIPGNWLQTVTSIDLDDHDEDEEKLYAGDNYVAVSSNAGKIFTFVWDGDSWRTDIFNERVDKGILTNIWNLHAMAAFGHNYFVHQQYYDNPDKFKTYYLDQTKKWNSVDQSITYNNSDEGRPKWYNANGFAFTYRNGGDEQIFRWDDNYNLFTPYSISNSLDHNSYTYISNSLISIAEPEQPSPIKSYRFNGSTWISFSTSASNYWNAHFAHDQIYWYTSSNGLSHERSFNPSTNSWGVTTDFELYGAPKFAGNNAFYDLLGTAYFKNSSGVWTSYFPLYWWSEALGYHNISYSCKNFHLTTHTNSSVYQFTIEYLKNGSVLQNSGSFESDRSFNVLVTNGPKFKLVTPNSMVTATSGNFLDKTSLTLHRIINFQHRGSFIDYPVYRTLVNDGDGNYIKTIIDYEGSTAVYDPTGTYVRYHKVTIIPGSDNVSNRPHGYTENYFFNGLSPNDFGELFTGDMLNKHGLFEGANYRTVVKDKDNFEVSRTEITFEAPYKDIERLVTPFHDVEITYINRVARINKFAEGIEAETKFTYNSTTMNQIQSQESYFKSEAGISEKIKTAYTYWWEVYDASRSRGVLQPITQEKKTQGANVLALIATRYKDWPATNNPFGKVPSPFDTYIWKGTGLSNFTQWEVSGVPSATDWSLQGQVVYRDPYSGNELERLGTGGDRSSFIYDDGKSKVIAMIGNASYDEVAFSSFEDDASGNIVVVEGSVLEGDSKTGNKCLDIGLQGITATVHTGSYKISFWAKSSNGTINISGIGNILINSPYEWSYYEYSIAKVDLVELKKIGASNVLIDELRIHPENARMTTMTYHPLYGISSHTDYNNITTYYSYDHFGRQTGIFDENRDLIKAFRYHLKQ